MSVLQMIFKQILPEDCYLHEVCQPAVIHIPRHCTPKVGPHDELGYRFLLPLPGLPWGIMGFPHKAIVPIELDAITN